MTNVTKAKLAITITDEQHVMRLESGETLSFKWSELSPEMVARILGEGALRILRDCKGNKTETEAFAATAKRVDAWRNGSFTIVDKSDAVEAEMLTAHIAAVMERTGATEKVVKSAMADLIAAQLPNDAGGKRKPLNWDNFLKAMARQHKWSDAETAEYDAPRRAAAEAVVNSRRAASASVGKLDMSDLI